jgi:lysophospholipase L1-like esterase
MRQRFAAWMAWLVLGVLCGVAARVDAATNTSFIRPLHRAIWIGDSLAARGFPLGGQTSFASGNFAVSVGAAGPIASIQTAVALPGMLPGPGNFVQIFNDGDIGMSAPLNGAVVPVLSVPNTSSLTVGAAVGGAVMASGDYSAGYLGNAWQVKEMTAVMDTSWLSWLNAYMVGYFTVVANYAQGGTTSNIGVALIPKIQAGPVADYAFIQYCTNDVNALIPPDVSGCLANINAIVTAVLNLGMVPIICTPLAIGNATSSPDPASSAKNTALQTIRNAELQIAASNPKVLVLDGYGASANPQDPLGRYLPNYAPVDGIHPSSFGAASIAKNLAAYLSQYLPPVDTLPTSINNDQTINPNATDIIQNGLMAGSAGTALSSPYNVVTGTPPTGWSVTSTGGSATQPVAMAVTGNNTHGTFPGYTLDLAIKSASAGQGFQIGTSGSGGSSFAGRMRANQWYQCGFQAFSNGPLTALNLSGQIFLNFDSKWLSSVYFMGAQGSTWENGIPWVAGQALTFESQPFFVSQPPAVGAWLFVNGVFSGTASGQTLSLGRAFCNIVANPYTIKPVPAVTASASAVYVGQTATLSAWPAGTGPFTYQWYQGASGDVSTPIAGATGARFTTPSLTQTITYWVRVTGPAGVIQNGLSVPVIVVPLPPATQITDSPLPLWALGGLAMGLVGTQMRRISARRGAAASGSGRAYSRPNAPARSRSSPSSDGDEP